MSQTLRPAMPRLIRYPGLRSIGITFSRTHLRRLIAAGQFPAPVQLGEATVAWLEDEIVTWIDGLRANRSQLAAPADSPPDGAQAARYSTAPVPAPTKPPRPQGRPRKMASVVSSPVGGR